MLRLVGYPRWPVRNLPMDASCGTRRHQVGKYTHVVIDAGGHDSTTLRGALVPSDVQLSDVLLIPYLPHSVDVWALADIVALIDGSRAVRDGLAAGAVLNCADPGSSANNTEAIAALTEFPQSVGLKTSITRRKAFANATAQGLAVDELTPGDPKASAELSALVDAVRSLVKPARP